MMKTELDFQIQKMMDFIHSLSPEVRVEYTDVIYEDENANLKVYPPLTWDEESCLDLQHEIAERVVDVLVDSGYFILVYVYSPEEQIALARSQLIEARRKMAQVQQQSAEANQFLAQAAALGLA